MAREVSSVQLQWRSVCPIASGLDVLGDKWSLVIVRDLIQHGTRTYSEFIESPEGISTNILAARLKLLSASGLIEHVDPDRAARNNAYRLTDAGLALQPVLEQLARWSQAHLKAVHPSIVTIF
jgi:DNA-binding HxlR family transcriptional regulator